jgi:hypothetical protein
VPDLIPVDDPRLVGPSPRGRALLTGLSDTVQQAATLRVRIPMHHGVDSLNVAAATAIACHALRRR